MSTLERFILRTTWTSPFGRKVRVAAQILGLADRITIVPADVSDENDTLRTQNPLGKIPCLVGEEGSTVVDSGVIVEYLQHVAGGEKLVPAAGAERFRMLSRARLADGIIDAAALTVYEGRWHDAASTSEPWIAYQAGKVLRALAAFEIDPPDPKRTDVVSLGLSCALEFLDRRKLVDWRAEFPGLAEWLAIFAAHEPAHDGTRAAAP